MVDRPAAAASSAAGGAEAVAGPTTGGTAALAAGAGTAAAGAAAPGRRRARLRGAAAATVAVILVACQPAHAQPEQGAQQARAAAAALAPYEPPQFAAAPAAMASCGRARSRVAREIVQEHIISPAAAVGFDLPAACSLAPSNDVLSTHEQSKSMRRRGQWQCGICGKLFRTEEHLDQHLQNRHGDLSPPGARVCLADLCDVLHCDAKLPGATAASLRRQPCRAHDMERARHQCEAHLHQCFPPGAPPQLAHRFQETFCDTLTCDARHKAVAMLRPAVSAWRVWWWIGLVMAIVVNVAVLASLTWRNVQRATRRDLQRVARGSVMARLARFVGVRKRQKVY